MSDVKWIKIATDIFDDDKILLIESLPDADSIIVIWFKLLCMAGKQNNSGVFLLNDRIAYTDEMLATIFRRNVNTVRLAISTFEKYGMVEIVNDTITIPNWEKHQQLDALEKSREVTRQRVARYRAKQKLIAGEKLDCNVTGERTVTESNADRIDKNRIEYKEEERACARTREEDPLYGIEDKILPFDTVQQYAINNLATMGYRAMEELNSFIDDLNGDIVRHAIDNALDNGVKNWSYVRAILNDYAEAGVKTVGEAKAQDDKRKKVKSGNKGQQEKTQPVEKPWDKMTKEEQEYALNHGPFGKFY